MYKLTTFSTEDNAIVASFKLLSHLRAKVSRLTLADNLVSHPDYPSMLALSETLTEVGVRNAALHLESIEQLDELPTPFLAHLNYKGGWYVVVNKLKDERITYTDSEKGTITEELTDFQKKWTNVVLLAEVDSLSGEDGYESKHKIELISQLRKLFIIGSFFLTLMIILVNINQYLTLSDWLLIINRTLGLFVSVLLVYKTLGFRDPLAEQLCSFTPQINCDKILKSKASKLFEWLSWAEIGMLYFISGIFLIFLSAIFPSIKHLNSVFSLLVLPYSFFSIYYQRFVVQQWCSLCTFIQVILLLDAVFGLSNFGLFLESWQSSNFVIVAFIIPATFWAVLKPLLISQQNGRQNQVELMRLKRNPTLFFSLLSQQDKMPLVSADLHAILIGNPDAQHTITMVSNPYCGPCAKMHFELEQLIKKTSNINLQVIFICDGVKGLNTKIALHLIKLKIQSIVDVEFAISDWYKSPEKNFDKWAKKHPTYNYVENYDLIIRCNENWCREASIETTPTLYMDGYKIPTQFKLSDISKIVN
ncbi:hypothetical protein GCM10023187_53050 [Nibrella viscosa]|uniref:Peptidase C39 domain-containing protein n=1 Tax=Nibrella viscosa TaxID=1084524 RepID=A0ABP8KZ65_9BACT